VNRLVVVHSHMVRCGVREYGVALDRVLHRLGVQLIQHSYADLSYAYEDVQVGDVLLVHFERGLVNPDYLNHYLALVKQKGPIPIVFCCHWYERSYMTVYDPFVDRYVLHKKYPAESERAVHIPLACPPYAVTDSRAVVRKRLGLPEDAVVLTTLGFLTPHKRFPDVARSMLAAMRDHSGLFLHLHTPWPFEEGVGAPEEARVRRVLDGAGGRSLMTTGFLSERETLDTAYASDVGFFFHWFDTGSASAATKAFVATRRPLAITGSSHVSDLQGGILKVAGFDPDVFARDVVALALDPARREALAQEMEGEYARLNMMVVAKQYAALFASLS